MLGALVTVQVWAFGSVTLGGKRKGSAGSQNWV
jgi:hypothetical protein